MEKLTKISSLRDFTLLLTSYREELNNRLIMQLMVYNIYSNRKIKFCVARSQADLRNPPDHQNELYEISKPLMKSSYTNITEIYCKGEICAIQLYCNQNDRCAADLFQTAVQIDLKTKSNKFIIQMKFLAAILAGFMLSTVSADDSAFNVNAGECTSARVGRFWSYEYVVQGCENLKYNIRGLPKWLRYERNIFSGVPDYSDRHHIDIDFACDTGHVVTRNFDLVIHAGDTPITVNENVSGNVLVEGVVKAPIAFKGKVGGNIVFADNIDAPVAYQNSVGGKIIVKGDQQNAPSALQGKSSGLSIDDLNAPLAIQSAVRHDANIDDKNAPVANQSGADVDVNGGHSH